MGLGSALGEVGVGLVWGGCDGLDVQMRCGVLHWGMSVGCGLKEGIAGGAVSELGEGISVLILCCIGGQNLIVVCVSRAGRCERVLVGLVILLMCCMASTGVCFWRT
jgi:hypothetical protein